MKIMDKELYREIDREHLAYIIKQIYQLLSELK